MRTTGSDTQHCEVKEAVHGIPKSLAETISAFANKDGGMIILGLSEKHGFVSSDGFDAGKIYSQLQTVGDLLTPAVRLEIEKVPFERNTIVAAAVPALAKNQKPCYISARGRYEGSFIRSGDGDRHLTPYEVDRLIEGHVQPQFDIEPIDKAGMEDLDPDTLKAVIRRARSLFPRVFSKLSDETILIQLGVAARVDDNLVPTLGGLLAAGIFPQRYFPRLQVVFTVYPGTTKVGDPATGTRYLDSKELVGSIPDLIIDTLSLVQQRMNTAGLIQGGLRKDIPDYPLIAVREAVANALQHRDYSPEGRGTHVQVNMYADRLEITNPGGLYGATTVESLGKEGPSSTRNEFLSRLLTNTPFQDGFVVENKGSGFMTIEASLANALMPPARIQNSLTFFSVTFEKQRKTIEDFSGQAWDNLDEGILSALKIHGTLSVKEIMTMSGFSRVTVAKHIRTLTENGSIEQTEVRKSPKQRYRLS